MRGHGLFAVANALAHHERPNQACHGGVDVHHGAAGEVKRAGLPDVAGLGIHAVDHLFAGVGVWAHPKPNHVRDWRIAEGEPQGHEGQHGRELHALGKGADDQAGGDTGKRSLVGGKQDFRNDHALAEGGSVGKSAGRVVPDAFHEQPVKAAEKCAAFGKRQAVAIHKPQHHDEREGHHDLHQHRQHVLGAHQPAIKQRQAGHRHHDDQQRADHHPGVIALVGNRRRRCCGCGGCRRCCNCSGRRCSGFGGFGFGSGARGCGGGCGCSGLCHGGSAKQQS